jgi:hypothetical protein
VVDAIGWIATALFAASYLCQHPLRLRRVQALAACFWIGYGVLIRALPVIAANSLVALAALYSARGRRPQPRAVTSASARRGAA